MTAVCGSAAFVLVVGAEGTHRPPCPCVVPQGLPHPAHGPGPMSVPAASLQLPTAAKASLPVGPTAGRPWPLPIPGEVPDAEGWACAP